MKNIIVVLFFATGFIKAQKLEYKFLTKDQNNEKWYYAFDKKTDDGFYSWIKSEYTFENDPSTESTEYYIENQNIIAILRNDYLKNFVNNKKRPVNHFRSFFVNLAK